MKVKRKTKNQKKVKKLWWTNKDSLKKWYKNEKEKRPSWLTSCYEFKKKRIGKREKGKVTERKKSNPPLKLQSKQKNERFFFRFILAPKLVTWGGGFLGEISFASSL